MKKLKLSYSLLKAWESGKRDELVDLYLRMGGKVYRGMERGKAFDLMVEEYVNKNQALPPELGGEALRFPRTKVKSFVPYNDKIDLSFEMDIYAKPYVYEIKCSEAQDSSDYATDYQVPFYLLVTELARDGELVLLFDGNLGGIIYRYNPVLKEYDRSVIYKNKKLLREVAERIDKNADNIYQFLTEKGVL